MWDDCFSVRRKKTPASLWLIFRISKIWNSVPTFSYMYNIHTYTYIKVPQDTEAAKNIIIEVMWFSIDQTLFYAACAPHAVQ